MEVFSTALLPPVPYLQLLTGSKNPCIDLGEHFIRQTSRNRMMILTANGPMALIIPLRKGISKHVGDIEISYEEPWQTKTWQAILSAYKNAPYFEEYAPELEALWMEKIPHLASFNKTIFNWVLKQLYLPVNLTYSHSYLENGIDHDYRPVDFSAPVPYGNILAYKQVFTHKFGFVPYMSVLDLLMNKGPEARMFIDKYDERPLR